MPSHPTTPLPAEEFGQILGASLEIGADGVVTYHVPRKETIILGGHKINLYLNVAPKSLSRPTAAVNAAAIPDSI